MIHKNKTKARLQAGEVAIGCALTTPSPHMVELIGAMGFDHVFIDAEHGSMDVSQVEELVRAAELYGLTPIARVPVNSYHDILRFLDRGVMGIVAPHISSKADAEAAVHAAKYHPEGERGAFGAGRLSSFGTLGLPLKEYFQKVNEEVIVIALIESVEGVDNIEEIASVPGIDVLNIGPSDLAQSYGMIDRDELEQHIDKVLAAGKATGKATGVGGCTIAAIERTEGYAARGCRYFNFSSDDMFKLGARTVLERFRG